NQIGRTLQTSVAKRIQQSRIHVAHVGKRLIDPQRKLQDAAIRCDELLQRLESETLRGLFDRQTQIDLLRGRLGSPTMRIGRERDLVQALTQRMRTGIRVSVTRKGEQLQKHAAVLDSLSPLKVLDRGYSMVTVGAHVVSDATELKVGQSVEIRLGKGSVEAEVKKVKKQDK
ncbi:MAG TPA: exodeoxyribonuclease VII large subunit, partial [Bdellovibrionales bacterium]|nr:exodeoxyribonuclease VII large subunit [Bdellovibrionales bacterium]